MRTGLLLLALLFGGCGASPEYDEVSAVGDSPEKKEPPPPPKETEDIRKSLDVLRCFLLHEKEVKEGRAPKDWKQPPMEEYEKSDDPCSLLPGFEDPRKKKEETKKAPPPPKEFEIGMVPIRRRR